MIQKEISKLINKVKEFKVNYEEAKARRESLSSEMSLLDEQINVYEKKLKELKTELNYKRERKEFQKKDTKPAVKRTIIIFGLCILINAIASIFLKNITSYTEVNILDLVRPALFASIMINMLPNIILRGYYSFECYKVAKKYDNIEKERNKTISKRISLGCKYKNVWEEEVTSKKIYIEAEKLLSSELALLYNQSDEYHPIDTRDIYRKITVDETYYHETIENQKNIIDKLLKEYLIVKIIESNYTNVDLLTDSLGVEDLFLILLKRVPKANHHETLNHIIHAILGISGNMQNYSIVWYEDNNEELVTNPEIIFDETDKWTELKTHRNTDYETIFKSVYDTFMNDLMIKKSASTKKRKNKK